MIAANHMARSEVGGFMQVNHGKKVPLRRLEPGDLITQDSPVQEFGGKQSLQAFTAWGS